MIRDIRLSEVKQHIQAHPVLLISSATGQCLEWKLIMAKLTSFLTEMDLIKDQAQIAINFS